MNTRSFLFRTFGIPLNAAHLKTGMVVVAVSSILLHCTHFTTNPTGSLQGYVVTLSNNRPLPDAEILLVGDSAMTITDADGFFIVPDISSGAQMLIVRKPHFAPRSVAVLVQTNALSRTDTIRLSADFAMLTGEVRDTLSGSPVQYAKVLLRGASDSSLLDSMTTGNDGLFTFDTVGMIDSGYRVVIDKQGYARRSFPQKINSGDSVFIIGYLHPLVTKNLFVFDADTKTPLSLAHVRYTGGEAQCDSQGSVSVTIAVPGSGLFEAWAAGYDTLSYRDSVTAGNTTIDSLPLRRQRGWLNGLVRCMGKRNHAGTVVKLSGITSDTTDSSGTFSFSNIPAGAYPLTATRPDFALWADTVYLPGNDTATVSAVLVITAGTIEDTVVWNAEGSPYRIDSSLIVIDNGFLVAQAGAVIRMMNGARLSTIGNGVFRTSGSGWNLVRIGANAKGDGRSRMEICGNFGTITMKHTLVEDVTVIMHDGPVVDHCLFAYTDAFFSDTTVYVDVSDHRTSFDQCDFIRNGTDAPGVFVRDSLYTENEEGGEVVFSNCIFSHYAGAATGSPFITSNNSGNIIVQVRNCSVYTDGDRDVPPFDFVHIDTSSVWRIKPEYNNVGQGDFYLEKESVLLDISLSGGFLGALGTASLHSEDMKQ